MYMCYLSIYYPEPDECTLISLFITLTFQVTSLDFGFHSKTYHPHFENSPDVLFKMKTQKDGSDSMTSTADARGNNTIVSCFIDVLLLRQSRSLGVTFETVNF